MNDVNKMPGPVGRWLETFMCKHYAETFEAFGFQTLQSVCQLQLSQLQAMGVAQEHCNLILENVFVLRQTLSAGNSSKHHISELGYNNATNPVNLASSALRSVAMSTNYPRGPPQNYQEEYANYGQANGQRTPNMSYSKHYEDDRRQAPELSSRGYGSSFPSQNPNMMQHGQQHGQQQMIPQSQADMYSQSENQSYINHNSQQYPAQQQYTNPYHPQTTGQDNNRAYLQSTMQQHSYDHQQMINSVSPQAVADNILQMASAYPQSQTVQVPLNKNRHAPYHVPSQSYNLHPPTAHQMSMNQQRMHHQTMISLQQQAALSTRTSPVSPMPLQSPISHHSNQSIASPASIHSPSSVGVHSPAQSPCGGIKSPCSMPPMASPHSQSMKSPSHGLGHGYPQTISSSPQRNISMRSPAHPHHYSPNPVNQQASSPYHSSHVSVQSPVGNYNLSTSYINESEQGLVQPSGDSFNPLQSLQKLVMLPETRVVDPKSVVNDACMTSSERNENSKNCDSSAEWLNKDCSYSAGSTNQSSPDENRPISCIDHNCCSEDKTDSCHNDKKFNCDEFGSSSIPNSTNINDCDKKNIDSIKDYTNQSKLENKSFDNSTPAKDLSPKNVSLNKEPAKVTEGETKHKLSPPKKKILNAYNESLQENSHKKCSPNIDQLNKDVGMSKTDNTTPIQPEHPTLDTSKTENITPIQPENPTLSMSKTEIITPIKAENPTLCMSKTKNNTPIQVENPTLGMSKAENNTPIQAKNPTLDISKTENTTLIQAENPTLDMSKGENTTPIQAQKSTLETCKIANNIVKKSIENKIIESDVNKLIETSTEKPSNKSAINKNPTLSKIKSLSSDVESEEELQVRKDSVNTYSRAHIVSNVSSACSIENMRNEESDSDDDEDYSFNIETVMEESSDGSSDVHSEVEENYNLEEDPLDDDDLNNQFEKPNSSLHSEDDNQPKQETSSLPNTVKQEVVPKPSLESSTGTAARSPRKTRHVVKQENISLPIQIVSTNEKINGSSRKRSNSDSYDNKDFLKKLKLESDVVEISDSSDDEKPLIYLEKQNRGKSPKTSTPQLKSRCKAKKSFAHSSNNSEIFNSKDSPIKSMKNTKKKAISVGKQNKSKSNQSKLNHKKKKTIDDKKECFKDMKFDKTLHLLKNKRKSEQVQNFSPFVRLLGSKTEPSSVVVYHDHPQNDDDTKQKKAKGASTVQSSIQISNLPSDKTIMLPHSQTLGEENWVCALCGKRSSYKFLGDLFGPYYLESHVPFVKIHLESENKKENETKKHKVVSERKRRKSSNESVVEKPNEVWVHENCTLWSDGVYLLGSKLYGLEEAIKVASSSTCSLCKEMGAMIGCLHKGCNQKYHFMCATESNSYLDEDNFSLLCFKHKDKRKKVVATCTSGSTT